MLDPNRELDTLTTYSSVHFDTSKAVRYAALDVDNFKLYNLTFGYEEATIELNTLVRFLLDLQQKRAGWIVEVLRVGGDEFLLALGSTDSEAESWLISTLKLNAPVGVTIAFGNSPTEVLRRLAIESHLTKRTSGPPLSRRHPETKKTELEIDITSIQPLGSGGSNGMRVKMQVTMHWKDPRFKKLPFYNSDTVDADQEANIWAPRLTLGDWVAKEHERRTDTGEPRPETRRIVLSRTITKSWEPEYSLRVCSVKETAWIKVGDDISDAEADYPHAIKDGTVMVFGSPDPFTRFKLPPKDTSWKESGFVKCTKAPSDEPYPLPRIATPAEANSAVEIGAEGFLRITGFTDEGKKHTKLTCERNFQDHNGHSTNAMFFPYDFIEDKISFSPNPAERNMEVVWQDLSPAHLTCSTCYGTHIWALGGRGNAATFVNSKRECVPCENDETDACLSSLTAFGFDFTILKSVCDAGPFLGKQPVILIEGWRRPSFYRTRLQIPLSVITIITSLTFLLPQNNLAEQLTIILTSFLVLSSMLVVSSSFHSPRDGNMTILDLQVLFNVMFMLVSSIMIHVLHFSCEELPKATYDTVAFIVFSVHLLPMMILNFIFTYNPCCLATDMRYHLYKLTMASSGEKHDARFGYGSYFCGCQTCLQHSLYRVKEKIRRGRTQVIGPQALSTRIPPREGQDDPTRIRMSTSNFFRDEKSLLAESKRNNVWKMQSDHSPVASIFD